jgi:hypothetical protein
MTTLNHYGLDSISSLTSTLERFAEAGIDPAFDTECEELERQYAELRLTFGRDA